MNTKIILVEDNPVEAEMTVRALAKSGVDPSFIVWLKDGEQALEFFFNTYVNLDEVVTETRIILLDIKMPKVDGMEVLESLKINPITKKIPVVVMTSSTDERYKTMSYQLGANSFMVKCLDYDEFQNQIKKLNRLIFENVTN